MQLNKLLLFPLIIVSSNISVNNNENGLIKSKTVYTSFITYDDDDFSLITSGEEKFDVYANKYIAGDGNGHYKCGTSIFQYVLLKLNNASTSDGNSSIYQLNYCYQVSPNTNTCYDGGKLTLWTGTKFAWFGANIERINADLSSTAWGGVNILEVTPRTSCDDKITYSEGVNLSFNGKNPSISYNNTKSYSDTCVSISDYSLTGSTNPKISTMFNYNKTGGRKNSTHMTTTSCLNGGFLFSLSNNTKYTIELQYNFGFGEYSIPFNWEVYEFSYKQNNNQDYSHLISFIS